VFRDLIPRLADKYHVIAPDHLGFGYSAMPTTASFEYRFAALASLTISFTEKLGLTSYAIFVQDYGAPIGWRMALEHPERITARPTPPRSPCWWTTSSQGSWRADRVIRTLIGLRPGDVDRGVWTPTFR
jgi:pimeloyl-ACP methyl ester carboxylesterase